jgi:hypothetical protein
MSPPKTRVILIGSTDLHVMGDPEHVSDTLRSANGGMARLEDHSGREVLVNTTRVLYLLHEDALDQLLELISTDLAPPTVSS